MSRLPTALHCYMSAPRLAPNHMCETAHVSSLCCRDRKSVSGYCKIKVKVIAAAYGCCKIKRSVDIHEAFGHDK